MTHPDFRNGLTPGIVRWDRDEISDLVLGLADHGLRLAEIEAGMKQHLEQWLRAIEHEKVHPGS